MLAFRKLLELDSVVGNPLGPGFLVGELRLELLVLDETAFEGIGQQHGPWAESPLAHDGRGVNIQHTDFTGENDQAIRGDHITAGAKPVAV